MDARLQRKVARYFGTILTDMKDTRCAAREVMRVRLTNDSARQRLLDAGMPAKLDAWPAPLLATVDEVSIELMSRVVTLDSPLGIGHDDGPHLCFVGVSDRYKAFLKDRQGCASKPVSDDWSRALQQLEIAISCRDLEFVADVFHIFAAPYLDELERYFRRHDVHLPKKYFRRLIEPSRDRLALPRTLTPTLLYGGLRYVEGLSSDSD
jgi:hypothetical protein